MSSEYTVTIDQGNWQSEVLEATTPVLVDFWAEWCGPCKAIAPILDELSTEKAGALKVAKVNVDQNQALASQFQVRAIPTLLLFKDGAVKETIVGMMSKAQLEAKLAAHTG